MNDWQAAKRAPFSLIGFGFQRWHIAPTDSVVEDIDRRLLGGGSRHGPSEEEELSVILRKFMELMNNAP